MVKISDRFWLIQILERLEYSILANEHDYLEFVGDSEEVIIVEFDEKTGGITSIST